MRMRKTARTLIGRAPATRSRDDRWRRLIVDLRAAEPLPDQTPGLLAGVFLGRVPRAAIVVVAARGSALERPDRDVIAAANRHALAVRQALRWAAQAAAAGEFEPALRALDTIERVEGTLPAEWGERRQAWQAAATMPRAGVEPAHPA